MNKKQITCDSCGFYFEEFRLHKNKDGKKYCGGCRMKIVEAPLGTKTISQKDFDKMLRVLLNTPPLKLKDLKEQLKKKREKKKKSESKGSSKSKKSSR